VKLRHSPASPFVILKPLDLDPDIDEKTALVLTDDCFEVTGEGAARIIDAGDLTYT
jgi:cyanophycinase-like exopeptidase